MLTSDKGRIDRQGGVALIEALIAILIFSIGVVGLIGLLGMGVKSTSDAKYRADAAYLANQLMSQIWVDNHDDAATLGAYAHRATDGNCAPTGANSGNAYMTGTWLTDVSTRLPGAAADRQQVVVTTASNTITVTICWREPSYVDSSGNALYHRYTTTAQIRG